MAFDLVQYICPANAPAYILLGIGYEVCQVQRTASGYTYQVKNANAETLWFDGETIYRGLDTSPNATEVYAQFTGERYGAAWARRYMDVGQTFKRSPIVKWWLRNGTPILHKTAQITDWIKLAAYYPEYTFALTGRTVKDVIRLEWLPDVNGKPGTTINETYWYAKGIGLVGFGATGQHSAIAKETPPTTPQREVLTWFTEPVPPPTNMPVPPSNLPALINPRNVKVNQPAGITVRRTPSLASGNTLGAIPFNAVAKIGDNTPISADGYQWIRVDSAQGNGYSAKTVGGRESFVPTDETPAPQPLRLVLPFLASQKWVITSRFNDKRSYGDHEGVDWGLPAPIPPMPVICAAADGVIDRIAVAPSGGIYNGGYGKYIRLRHQLGDHVYYTWYAHCDWIPYESTIGKQVKAGEPIAVAGQTGNADGLHLHFTLQHIGHGLSGYSIADVVDPLPYFE